VARKKVKVSLTLDSDVVEWIDKASEGMGMNRSEFVNFVLRGGIDAKEKIESLMTEMLEKRKEKIRQVVNLPLSARRR